LSPPPHMLVVGLSILTSLPQRSYHKHVPTTKSFEVKPFGSKRELLKMLLSKLFFSAY
jgi:hypothetical protein